MKCECEVSCVVLLLSKTEHFGAKRGSGSRGSAAVWEHRCTPLDSVALSTKDSCASPLLLGSYIPVNMYFSNFRGCLTRCPLIKLVSNRGRLCGRPNSRLEGPGGLQGQGEFRSTQRRTSRGKLLLIVLNLLIRNDLT